MRIKSRWHDKSRPKSLEQIAGAMGFNIWKMASTTANKMYNDGFNFRDNGQLLDVIGEYVIFLLQLADRVAYEQLDEEARQQFTSLVAHHLINTMVENRVDELGPGDYQAAFIDTLNQRLDGYAEFSLVDGAPSYPMLRYLGDQVETLMGGSQNKWVKEQVMEVVAPELVKTLRRGLDPLLESRSVEDTSETPAPSQSSGE
ncbi:MAG TPA: hypothetical protein VGE50_12245 [Gammaproteobacteria bacterium]